LIGISGDASNTEESKKTENCVKGKYILSKVGTQRKSPREGGYSPK
jgi:hypothetical protein